MVTFHRYDIDDIPPNSVVVRVWQVAGQAVADIVCRTGDPDGLEVAAEFPLPAALALKRAEHLRRSRGLHRIAVVLESPQRWQSSWGSLIERSGRRPGPPGQQHFGYS